ncbi:TPA: ABC transporter permease [Candidatus Bipolaricaulota bacterium]|nr:ABC transporter permease [Candidatus Bipolaricaulota bacterium]
MLHYVVRKVFASVPIVLGVTLIVFAILHLTPGDPIRIMLGFGGGGYSGGTTSSADVEALRAKWGLDQPFHVQYLKWLNNMFHGDMGISIRFRCPVWPLVRARLFPTISLSLVGYLIAFVIAFPIGILSALKRNSLLDYFGTGFSLFGMSMPSFWLGLMLILLISVRLRLLPTSGLESWKSYIMPGFTLGFGLAGGLTRMVRSSMLEVLRQDYITTARAKGLVEHLVIIKHALRNAFIPVLTILGFYLAYIFSGSILIETVFAWPGMGRLLVQALTTRDYPVVQAIVLLGAGTVVIANLVTDLLYGAVDPRIRYE